MSNLKHTPAPWRIERDGWNSCHIMKADTTIWIAETSLYYDSAEANARLISCAPEMLEVLINEYKNMCEYCGIEDCEVKDNDKRCGSKMKEVIEKATGLKIEEAIK